MSNIAPARPSSTVVVVRKGLSEPEIFMVRRHAESSFGAAFAFPGGVIDTDDTKVHAFCTGLSTSQANRRLGVKENGLDFYSAAIRELFEESGVLLASGAQPDADLGSVRDGLNDGSRSWSDFVTEAGLELHCDQLHYFSHWVTPTSQPRRTRRVFF